MNKINWENGTLVSPAKVEIGGVIYEVSPEQYSGNTPISAENLNLMQNNIEEAIDEKVVDEYSESTTKGYSANYINELNTYSTEEQRIGTYLGKPLYRKIIQIGKFNNTETNYPHGISNLGSIVSIKPKWYDTFENKWFANLRKDSETIYINFTVSNANLVVEAKGTNWNARTRDANCTIEYTKTTD